MHLTSIPGDVVAAAVATDTEAAAVAPVVAVEVDPSVSNAPVEVVASSDEMKVAVDQRCSDAVVAVVLAGMITLLTTPQTLQATEVAAAAMQKLTV